MDPVCVCGGGMSFGYRPPPSALECSKYMQQIYKYHLDYLLNLTIVRIPLVKNMDPPIIGISLARSNLHEIAVKIKSSIIFYQRSAFLSVSKARANKCYIFRQCTYIVDLSRYMWSSTLYTKYILVLLVINLFIIPTIYLNFILILSFNQKAIFMGSLMQWLYLERMKVYYPIKILDTTFSTHLHTNGPVINAPVNLTFTETFVNTTLKFSGHPR